MMVGTAALGRSPGAPWRMARKAEAALRADGFAAVLPCYWIYAEVGAELAKLGSPDPRYQRWIDAYAGDEYQTIVAEVLALADSVGPTLGAADEARARAHFATTARYEWMFWDAAWRGEVWPV